MNLNGGNKAATLLFNPFYFVAGVKALLIGLLLILAAGLLGSLSNTHFDGVLDTHTGAAAPLWIFIIEGIINWVCLAIVLAALGLVVSGGRFRIIDVFGTQALARWPTIILSLLMMPDAVRRFSAQVLEMFTNPKGHITLNVADTAVFAIVMLASLPVICWVVYLMYKSFSVSCNVKGGKAVGLFIVGLLGAEVLSKICIGLVLAPVLTNSANATPAEPATKPAEVLLEKSEIPAGDVAIPARKFVELLATGKLSDAEERFNATMKAALPEPRLRAIWQDLESKMGAFQKQVGTRTLDQAGYHVALVTCQFGNGTIDMKVVFDSKGQIAGLFCVPTTSK